MMQFRADTGDGEVFDTLENMSVWRVVAAQSDRGGHVGVTGAGRIAYRSADGFEGDETISLVLRDETGQESAVELVVAVEAGRTVQGWGEADHYVLARDEDGWSVAEAGARHRVIHVSPDGDRSADGATPDRAVTPQGYEDMLADLRLQTDGEGASWHVLFERGHDYGDYAPGVTSGEDPLKPFVIGAYGEGERPMFGATMRLWGNTTENLLLRDIAFERSDATLREVGATEGFRGFDMLDRGHANIALENVIVRPLNASMRLQSASEAVTLYRSAVLDGHRAVPANGAEDWNNPYPNRVSGLFAKKIDGLRLEDSLFDLNGWVPGYRTPDQTGPNQPPSQYSHNLYLQRDLTDVTLENNIVSRGASFGAQVRPSGTVTGNLFFENNIGLSMSGWYDAKTDTFLGNHGLLLDTVVTSPSNKNAKAIGARGFGATNLSSEGLVADLIVAQDGDGLDEGPQGVRKAFRTGPDMATEGVTVFNWGDNAKDPPDVTPEADGLSDADLLAVTLDNYARELNGAGADRFDLIDMWRDRDRDDWSATPDAADVVSWFQSGFGYETAVRPDGGLARFDPDPRADGFHWDNRLNWSDDLAPRDGDAVDLDGHAVVYGAATLSLAALDFGDGGLLRISKAALTVQSAAQSGALGGSVEVSGAGQIALNGYGGSGLLSVDVAGGRFSNTGRMTGLVDISVEDGQALLAEGAARLKLGRGSRLSIEGDDAEIGFDGASGTSVLVLKGGEIVYTFDEDGVSGVTEFRSGRHGDAEPGVWSKAVLRGGDITVDLTQYRPDADAARFTLIDVDDLRGSAGGLDLTVVGAAPDVAASLVFDAAADALFLDLTFDGFTA